ncbi:hypothetical protein [Rhodocaloribacter sp.]
MNRLSTITLTFILMLAVAPAAFGQRNAPPVWQDNIAEHLAESLDSPSEGIRTSAMTLVLELARRHPDLDLKATVAPLLDVYAGDPDPARRMMAMATLHALNDRDGLQRLAVLVRAERSPTVRRATLLALADKKDH